MEARTMQKIAVGSSDQSDGLMFYYPHTQQVYTISSYHLDKSGNRGIFLGLYSSASSTLSTADPVPEPYP
eukprot:10538411-Ditylum_brightwellii.AAC.1